MSPMTEDNDGPIHRWTPLDVRIEAVERFADCTEHVLTVGDLQWADVARIPAVGRQQFPSSPAGKHSSRHFAQSTRRGSSGRGICARGSPGPDVSRVLRVARPGGVPGVVRVGGQLRLPESTACASKLYRGQGDGTALVSKYFLEWAVARSEETRAVLTVLKKQYGWSGGIVRRGCGSQTVSANASCMTICTQRRAGQCTFQSVRSCVVAG